MKWLTLQMIKQQCRIEPDFTLEDELLTKYGESAEETILEMCNRTYIDIVDSYGSVPQNIVHASLLLVAISYQHREAASPTNLSAVPYGNIDMLLKPYMKLAGVAGDDMQTVTLGSDIKIEFTADLPDDLLLSDINFSGKVLNMNQANKETDFTKQDCIMTDEGRKYVVLVDTDTLGIGCYMLRLTVFIPDTDYPSGTRKEVIKINPYINVVG